MARNVDPVDGDEAECPYPFWVRCKHDKVGQIYITECELRHTCSFKAQVEGACSKSRVAGQNIGSVDHLQCVCSSERVVERTTNGLQEVCKLLSNVEGKGSSMRLVPWGQKKIFHLIPPSSSELRRLILKPWWTGPHRETLGSSIKHFFVPPLLAMPWSIAIGFYVWMPAIQWTKDILCNCSWQWLLMLIWMSLSYAMHWLQWRI